jgi:hypothetical protein
MEGLLKYFETLYKLSDVLYGYSAAHHKQYTQLEKLSTSEDKSDISNVEKRYSIADDEKVKKFFKTVLDYYYQQDSIPLNYRSTDVKEEIKAALIKRIPGYFTQDPSQHEEVTRLIEPIITDKAAKLYDLMDYMFLTLKKVLSNTKKGYNEALKVMGADSHLEFRKELHNISMYLYITFIHVFPIDLRLLLKKALRIDDLDQKIMDKCHGMIIRHNQERVCNIKRDDSPTSPIKSPLLDAEQDVGLFDFLSDLPGKSVDDKPDIALKSKYSIGMLLNIFSILQGRKRF